MKPIWGTKIDPMVFAPISREQLKGYAQASGDNNPIHLDEEIAKEAGLPGVIAHGMVIAAMIAERSRKFVEDEIAVDGWGIKGMSFRFRTMVLVGDVITVSAAIKQNTPQMLSLDLQAKNQRGDVVATAVTKYGLTKTTVRL